MIFSYKSEIKRAKNRAKQTLVTLTSQVHVNRDVNLFTENLQTANRKCEQSRHSIPKDPNGLHALILYLSVCFDEC